MNLIGRSATPIWVHHIWDAIDQCSTGSQGSVSFEQIMTTATSVHKVSRGQLNRELEAAVRDKLIIYDVIQSPRHEVTKLYKLPEQEISKPDNDWYCFHCHLGTGTGPLVGCKDCPRIFHLHCLPDIQKPNGDLFICPPCQIMATKPSAKFLDLEPNQLNKLLEHSCHLLKDWDVLEFIRADGKTWATASNREAKDKWRYDLLVYFNIDVSKMLEKAVSNKYQSLEEFQVDCETLIHGIVVYFGVKELKKANIASFHKEVLYIIQEVKTCHECFCRSCEKEKIGPLWFCLPCKTPHQAVWAKLSGYPHWPAKVMKIDGLKYDVQFFGGSHQLSTIDVKNILPIDTPLSSFKFRKTVAWNEAYEEMKQFLEIAEDPEKINSLPPTTKVGKNVTTAKSKGPAKKRASSSSVDKIGTKKSKKEVAALKTQEDIKIAESIITNHDYELSSPNPAIFDNDDNSEASTSSIPNLLQQPPDHVNTEDLTNIKIESDHVPIKEEPDQDLDQEIFTSCTAQSRENGDSSTQSIEKKLEADENTATNNNNMQEIQKEETEKETLVKLQEDIKNCTQNFIALSREKIEIQTTLQNKIDQLSLVNEQKQTTINVFSSLITQQWTENSQLKSQVAEQQTQIEVLNYKIRLNDKDQQSIENQDLNSIIALQRDEISQLKSQLAEQRKSD